MSTTSTQTGSDMQISERELLTLTSQLAEVHNDLRPRFLDAVGDLSDVLRDDVERARQLASRSASRRSFLRGGLMTAGAVGGGLAVAACGSSSTSTPTPTPGASGDLKVAQLAASLEVLAVSTYDTALKAAAQGSFGAVPAAFGVFATTAKLQHQDHENAWNAALTGAGLPAQKNPDPKYDRIVKNALPGLKTIADVASLALTLETVAFETYTFGASAVTSKQNRLVALTIAPVEAQHAAILNFILGKYPVPDAFIKTDMAASPSDLG